MGHQADTHGSTILMPSVQEGCCRSHHAPAMAHSARSGRRPNRHPPPGRMTAQNALGDLPAQTAWDLASVVGPGVDLWRKDFPGGRRFGHSRLAQRNARWGWGVGGRNGWKPTGGCMVTLLVDSRCLSSGFCTQRSRCRSPSFTGRVAHVSVQNATHLADTHRAQALGGQPIIARRR
jgi:hypothetical protein